MWKYNNFVAFLASLLLVGGWWQLVMYAYSHWNLTLRVETVSMASFVMCLGTRFVEEARTDSQSSPRQFLSQKLVISAALTSIVMAAILEISGTVLPYADKSPARLLLLLLAAFGAFMFRSLVGRRSRRNLLVMLSSSAIALAAALVFYFGSIDIVPFGAWIGFGMFVIAGLLFMFLTEWNPPSRIGTGLSQ